MNAAHNTHINNETHANSTYGVPTNVNIVGTHQTIFPFSLDKFFCRNSLFHNGWFYFTALIFLFIATITLKNIIIN